MRAGDLITDVHPVGDTAVLLDAPDGAAVRSLTSWGRAHPGRECLAEVIQGASPLSPAGPAETLRAILADAGTQDVPPTDAGAGRVHEVQVRYDGADLAAVAERAGVGTAEVIRLHTAAEYSVDFFGFSPGQAFLRGVDPLLHLPRRVSPRIRVPSGSVAIAGDYTVIYPPNSPGGWHLLGTRVSASLWDPARTPPNRVEVGDRLVFRAVS